MKKIFLFLILFFGLVLASSGTTTLKWPDTAYFTFSKGTVSYEEGIKVSDDPTKVFDILLELWVAPAWCANSIDLGKVDFDSMSTPPTSGYIDDVSGFANCDYVQVGHSYWIKTRDGEYAKVYITNAEYLGVDPEDGNMNTVTFKWVYYGDKSSGAFKPDASSINLKDCNLSLSLIVLSLLGAFYSKN